MKVCTPPPFEPQTTLLGFRVLVAFREDFYSPIYWTLWPPRTQVVASCVKSPLWHFTHVSPDPSCYCGIYVTSNRLNLPASDRHVTVLARLSGRIIIHEDDDGYPTIARGASAEVEGVVQRGDPSELACAQYFGVPIISLLYAERLCHESWTAALKPEERSP